MRSLLFNIFWLSATLVYALACLLFSILPGKTLMRMAAQFYGEAVVWGLDFLAGVKLNFVGEENIPDGLVIIAAKHQSYGDGIALLSRIDNVSFVSGAFVGKIPVVGHIVRKLDAVLIDNGGGEEARANMKAMSERVRAQGRPLFIYPEGHLSPAGTHHRYRKGIYHLYKDFNCPVVPAATNLGQRWNQTDLKKHSGDATIEFLEPIQPGLDKDEFIELLQDKIETRSIELLDLDNPGALNPDNIGKLTENPHAREMRLRREAKQNDKAPAGEIV